jgi:serine/threonine protein kinase
LSYWPPEIINDEPYTSKVDVWSIGVTFYEILTMMHPFYKESQKETKKAIKESNPFIPETISPESKQLIEKMLNKDP